MLVWLPVNFPLRVEGGGHVRYDGERDQGEQPDHRKQCDHQLHLQPRLHLLERRGGSRARRRKPQLLEQSGRYRR